MEATMAIPVILKGDTPTEHKAEISAGTGAAWFRVKIDTRNGTWEVYPL